MRQAKTDWGELASHMCPVSCEQIHPVDTRTRYQPLALCHYGMVQRWLVVYSQAAFERAEATLKKATQREAEAIQKQLFHLQAKRFDTPQTAQEALAVLAKAW